MEYFLYEEQFNQFIQILDGLFCGRFQCGLSFPKQETADTIHCQFRIREGAPLIVDLRGQGKTRVNGEVLEWGVARKLALNDVIELGQRKLTLTNHCVYVGGLKQDRTVSIRPEENPELKGATGMISQTMIREIMGPPVPHPKAQDGSRPDANRILIDQEKVELDFDGE